MVLLVSILHSRSQGAHPVLNFSVKATAFFASPCQSRRVRSVYVVKQLACKECTVRSYEKDQALA